MSKNILIIDDDGMITKTIGNLLKREGYFSEVVENGLQAIEKIRSNDFDLIITDIRMPQMDGIETISKIHKFLKEQGKITIPVIFITGFADSDAYVKAEKFGKVIYKPFDMRVFLDEVDKSLDEK